MPFPTHNNESEGFLWWTGVTPYQKISLYKNNNCEINTPNLIFACQSPLNPSYRKHIFLVRFL